MNRFLHELLFDSALRSQFAWRRKAAHLLKAGIVILAKSADARPAAEALLKGEKKDFSAEEAAPLEEFQLYDIGLFLVTLAIENLLKGLWVGRNYKRIKKINNMRKDLPELTTHKLGDVAKAAAMKLSSQEESLLSDLSKIIVWYGRYPAPLKVDEYGVQFQTGTPSNRFMAGPTIFSMELPFPTELDHFIARLLKELQTIPKENYV